MSNHEIKALIVLNRTSVSEIARRAGVTRQWVSQVVNGHKPSERIRKAVASAVGKQIEDLWPLRSEFSKDGEKRQCRIKRPS